MSDFILKAGIDFTDAEKQVKDFAQRTTKTLSDIKAKANAPGGSNSRPGQSGGSGNGSGNRSALEMAKQAIANERAYQTALTRTESVIARIGRQMDGNTAMVERARAAMGSYSSTIQTFGARSMEGARASGQFARSMNQLGSEMAVANGLLPTLNRGFGGVITALGTLSPAAGSAARDIGAISTGLRAAAVGAGAAIGVVGGVTLGFAAIGVAAIAAGAAMAKPVDAMNLLVGKLNAATGSMSQAKVLYAETVAIANRLGTSVGDVGTAMARFAGVGKDIGLANADVAGLTETFLKLGKVSGQTAQEAAASLTQLSQALASGRLQGDEYRSLAENMPALTREIAKVMGVTTGELKRVASEGTITTDIVLKALRNMTTQVNADFATIPRTVEQINAGISNQWDQLLINLDNKLHLSDLYKFFLQLPEKALQAANNFLAGPKPQERAADLQSQINTLDSQIARNPIGWMRKGLQNQRAELVKELDGIQTDMLRSAVETGEQTISADERAWQQRVDTAKRGAAELRKANDPVYKANHEYQDSLKKLNQSKPFISSDDYKTTLDAITQTRDAAIERANKSANAMTVEEKAVWRTEVAYSALRMELANAKVATEALSMGDMTVLDTKALERTVDFLTNFAKQAKIVPTTLEDLAQQAGVSLKELQAGFRAIEAETLKLQALKRSKDLGIETEETKRLANATMQGADAYAKVSREIEVERQLRALGLDAKDKDLASTREEIRLKLQAVEASREYAKAADFARNLVAETATPEEKAVMRLQELSRQYAKLKESGAQISPQIETAFERARAEAVSSTDVMAKAFKSFAESADDFPEDVEGERLFANLIKEAFE